MMHGQTQIKFTFMCYV